MIQELIQIDIQWFKAIHNGLANDLFDHLMPILRNKLTWIPLYAVFLFYSIKKYGVKSWVILLGTILTVLIADQVSAGLIKESVQRLRPCNDPHLQSYIRRLVDCGSGYSFISAHATNHFAVSVLFTWFFGEINNWSGFKFLFYVWAGLIAFAQVYVGVHFPLDVLVGMLTGLLIGNIMLLLIKNFLNR